MHHVHHQHAHQWLTRRTADELKYLDSQAIGPGASFTLEMVYNGSGNRNQTVGDSIFHCHFYPHFAQGMWALWRVHDVFEQGTAASTRQGRPAVGARALPDGEIAAGTPIPGLVPDARQADGARCRRRTWTSSPATPWSPAPATPATRSSSPASPATGRPTRRSTSPSRAACRTTAGCPAT